MSVPEYYRNVSMVLSRVLNDIGVNEECVMRQRKTYMFLENIANLRASLLGYNFTQYVFGSQTEGTTIRGLMSNTDILTSVGHWLVIRDRKDWSPGIDNYIMIQDETCPGYCKLQGLRRDMPSGYDEIPDENHGYDEKRRIILKTDNFGFGGVERHGAAIQITELIEMGIASDLVIAPYCPKWPKHYKQWSLRREARDWPTPEMIEYMERTGCFIVPVAHRCAERQDTEWRISTSLAERCLMFNLNITQIRCYVLLKTIAKTFIEPLVPDVISSYICKTILFHTLESTSQDFWREPNLLACVTCVLSSMYSAVYNMNCPNYFYESANLLFGKLDQKGTRERLLFILRKLLHSQCGFLLQIEFEDINSRMEKYLQNTNLTVRCEENEHERLLNFVGFHGVVCSWIVTIVREILTNTDRTPLLTFQNEENIYKMLRCVRCGNNCNLEAYLSFINMIPQINDAKGRIMLNRTLAYSKEGPFQYKVASLLFPFLCSHIATVDTSERIRRGQNVSPRALLMYKYSLDSDAASSRLKFASFLYCTGELKTALSVLQQVEQRMDSGAIQLCNCNGRDIFKDVSEYASRERGKQFLSTSDVGLCVMFSQAERPCCPFEMRFEYFRSTDEDKAQRGDRNDWMDLAVLDCLPLLHYLQYMAARELRQRELQHSALHKLTKSVIEGHLCHRETAFNVLGQCMEHENRFDDALLYYRMSYQHRPRNNAVRWHFARLAYIAIQRRK